MESSLQQKKEEIFSGEIIVSILVLMESSLQQAEDRIYGINRGGFNPCFNGIFSSTVFVWK